MAFSMEAQRYFAVYGEWKNPDDDAKYGNWATDRMREMESVSKGIQLADENLGRRPFRFIADDNLKRLDELRTKYDPDNVFNAWMGRPPIT